MSPSVYIYLMSLIERFKHKGHKSSLRFVRAFRHYKYLLLSDIANRLITHVDVRALASNESGSTKITASLTTFPVRIQQVRYAIMSILMQTVRPDRVILWLAKEQFPNEIVPDNLKDLCNYGLEVKFCGDLRSHKKYYYALQEQEQDEVVITFDDDIIYHPHTIERLMSKHKEHPDSIICNQAHVMTFDEKGNIRPYNQWLSSTDDMANPNKDFMPLTGSGCLYPFNVMPEITFDKDKLKKYAFTADDLWIGYIARIAGVSICITDKAARIFSVVKSSQTQHLGQVNCLEDGNDRTMRDLTAVITDIYKRRPLV